MLFPLENWKHSKEEIQGIMKILAQYIRWELERIHKNNIKIQVWGI